MTFEQWIVGVFPWLTPEARDYQIMKMAWDAAKEAK